MTQETFTQADRGIRVKYEEGIGGLNTTGIIESVWLEGYRIDIRDDITNELHVGIASDRCEICNIYRILYVNHCLMNKPGVYGIVAESEEKARIRFTESMRSFCEIKSIERDNSPAKGR